MAWSEVRLCGDAFGAHEHGRALRAFLHLARARGFRVALALAFARSGERGAGRKVTLTDGAGPIEVWTSIPEAELAVCLEAGGRAVAATAPLVVFGGEDERTVAQALWPEACHVANGGTGDPETLVRELATLLANVPETRSGWRESELAPFLDLAPASVGATLLHFGSSDPVDGTDLAVIAFARLTKPKKCELLIATSVREPEHEAALEELYRRHAGSGSEGALVFHGGVLDADLLHSVAAIVLPLRRLVDPTLLVSALASARPVVVSAFAATDGLCGGPGTVLEVGGRNRADGAFEPDLRSLEHAMGQVFAQRFRCMETAARARAHVISHLRRGAPATPAVPKATRRPLVVLEAPLAARSSTSVLTLATAAALRKRDRVDLRIVPSRVGVDALASLRREHPELAELVTGRVPEADLWLAAGWPPRRARPRARTFALRFDWEYGALPTDLVPPLVDGADRVVVHSESVRRVLTAAGREPGKIDLVPHGVDGGHFHEAAPPLEEVLAWKGGRKALLFVGGLIWCKGIDVLLKALTERHGPADGLCLVVKSIGADTTYRGYELGELLARYARARGAIPTLHLERDLTPPEMAGLYRACDLLVHPYRGEGFGMPILEARACGVPVLVTAGGAADDLRLEFDTDPAFVPIPSQRRAIELPMPCEGVPFVREPNAESFAELLAECVRCLPELREHARQAAPALRKRFTWDAAAAALERLAFRAAGESALRVPMPVGSPG